MHAAEGVPSAADVDHAVVFVGRAPEATGGTHVRGLPTWRIVGQREG